MYRLTLVLSHEDIHTCDMYSQLPQAASVAYYVPTIFANKTELVTNVNN